MPLTINDFITQTNHWGFCGFISLLQKMRADGFRDPLNENIWPRYRDVIQRARRLQDLLRDADRKNFRGDASIEKEIAWLLFHLVDGYQEDLINSNNDDARRLLDETLGFTNAFWAWMAGNFRDNIAQVRREGLRAELSPNALRVRLLDAFHDYYVENEHHHGRAGRQRRIHDSKTFPWGLAMSPAAMQHMIRALLPIPGNQVVIYQHGEEPYNNQRDCILGVQFPGMVIADFENHPHHWVYIDPSGTLSNSGETFIRGHVHIPSTNEAIIEQEANRAQGANGGNNAEEVVNAVHFLDKVTIKGAFLF